MRFRFDLGRVGLGRLCVGSTRECEAGNKTQACTTENRFSRGTGRVFHNAQKAKALAALMYSLESARTEMWSEGRPFRVSQITWTGERCHCPHIKERADSNHNKRRELAVMGAHLKGAEMSFVDREGTIVVATDLEGRCEAALEYARKIAGAYKARIVLAHGIDPLDYATVEGVPGAVMRGVSERARAVLDGLAADLVRDGLHSHSEVRQGELVEMLLGVARQYNAGLLVVGTRGREGAGPLAVGSVAEQLVRRSNFPVLAVAEDWNAGEYRPVPGGPILLAMDRNESTHAAMGAACSLAATFHRTLIAVHARTAAEASAFLNPCATTLQQFGLRGGFDFPVRCEVKDGRPAEAIARAIAQHRPSILVAGVKRRSDSPGAHGTIFSLLAISRVPVLCVPVPSHQEAIKLETQAAATT